MLQVVKTDELKEAILHFQLEICVEGLCLPGWGCTAPEHAQSPSTPDLCLYRMAYCATVPSKQLGQCSFLISTAQLEISP